MAYRVTAGRASRSSMTGGNTGSGSFWARFDDPLHGCAGALGHFSGCLGNAVRFGRICVILRGSGSVAGSPWTPLLIRLRLLRSLPLFQSVFLHRGRCIRRCAMAHKLFIGGLSFSTSSERLREVFAQAGGVESATVVMEQETGRSRGFGFVEMTTAEDADAAVKKFNGQEMDGRTLKVEIAKSGGAGGKGGGYRSSDGRGGRY